MYGHYHSPVYGGDRRANFIDTLDADQLNTPIHHLDRAYARQMYFAFQSTTPLTISSAYHSFEHSIDEYAELSLGLIIYHTQCLVCNPSKEARDHVAIIEACTQALLARSTSTTDVCTCPNDKTGAASVERLRQKKEELSLRYRGPFRFHDRRRRRRLRSSSDSSSEHSSDEDEEEDDISTDPSSEHFSNDDNNSAGDDARDLSFKRQFKPGVRRVRFETPPSSSSSKPPRNPLPSIPSTEIVETAEDSDGEEYKEEGEVVADEEIAAKIKDMQRRLVEDRTWLVKTKGVKEEHVEDILTPEILREMERLNRAFARKFDAAKNAPMNFRDGDPIRVSLKSQQNQLTEEEKKNEETPTLSPIAAEAASSSASSAPSADLEEVE